MSFARFSDSDVYIFEHAGGYIQCCGCSLDYQKSLLRPTEEKIADYLAKSDSDEYEGFDFVDLATPREALAHLGEHVKLGDDIGRAKERILAEYPDLDVNIEPYVRDPESEKRVQQKLRDAWAGDEE
jgi:hypothetical protein